MYAAHAILRTQCTSVDKADGPAAEQGLHGDDATEAAVTPDISPVASGGAAGAALCAAVEACQSSHPAGRERKSPGRLRVTVNVYHDRIQIFCGGGR